MTLKNLEYCKFYLMISSVWTEITSDVIRDTGITVSHGNKSSGFMARCAETGLLTFTLNDSESNSASLLGYYSPGHANCRTGFRAGAEVKLEVSFDGRPKPKWRGRIMPDGIRVEPGKSGSRRTSVTCQDIMGDYATHEIVLPTIQATKRVDEVLPTLTALAAREPVATDYDTGDSTFPTVFDSNKGKTRILTELARLANSEIGYIYPRYNWSVDGETLVFESRQYRSSVGADTIIPDGNPGALLLEDGVSYLLLEDGVSHLLLDGTVSAVLEDDIHAANVSNGVDFANEITVTCHPRKAGSAASILWSLPINTSIAAGETAVFEGKYLEPTTKQACAATSVITPAATTDYTFYKAGPVDITADIEIVSFTAGANDFKIYVKNNNAARGYAGKFQVRGTPLTQETDFSYTNSDATSISTYGVKKSYSIDLKYADDVTLVSAFADVLLAKSKDPHTKMESITYSANRNDQSMQMFMSLECGDKMTITETVSGVDESHFIQGINWTYDGSYLECTYYTKRATDDQVYYQFYDVPTGDTYISSVAPTTNYGSSNLGATEETNKRRSLVKFDLSAAASVISASMRLYITTLGAGTLYVYRLKRAWVEAEATWNIYSTGNSWATAGGMGAADYDSTLVGSVVIPFGFRGWKEITLDPALITQMVNGTMTDCGFLIVGSVIVDGASFYSREGTYPPTLTLTYLA